MCKKNYESQIGNHYGKLTILEIIPIANHHTKPFETVLKGDATVWNASKQQ